MTIISVENSKMHIFCFYCEKIPSTGNMRNLENKILLFINLCSTNLKFELNQRDI